MKQKQMTWVAVGCGAMCALCVALFMASVQGQADSARAEALARYGGEQVEVCVATRDVAAGERLELSAVETRLWVADLLPEDAVRSSGDAVGKIATSSILKGEVISAKRFENARDSLEVPQGKQAVSVPVKAVQAVGGAVRPGMSVDLYSSGDSSTAAIAMGVVVLDTSVADAGSLVSSDSGWITLAVNPEDVQQIIAASNKTTLYFVIPGDQGETSSDKDGQPADEPGQEGETGSGSEDAGAWEAGSANADESAASAGNTASDTGETSAETTTSPENPVSSQADGGSAASAGASREGGA